MLLLFLYYCEWVAIPNIVLRNKFESLLNEWKPHWFSNQILKNKLFIHTHLLLLLFLLSMNDETMESNYEAHKKQLNNSFMENFNLVCRKFAPFSSTQSCANNNDDSINFREQKAPLWYSKMFGFFFRLNSNR